MKLRQLQKRLSAKMHSNTKMIRLFFNKRTNSTNKRTKYSSRKHESISINI